MESAGWHEVAADDRHGAKLNRGWINWSEPAFMQVDEEWKHFMSKQPNGGPSASDLRDAISQMSRLKVYQQNAAFEFKLGLDAPIR